MIGRNWHWGKVGVHRIQNELGIRAAASLLLGIMESFTEELMFPLCLCYSYKQGYEFSPFSSSYGPREMSLIKLCVRVGLKPST